MIPLRGRRVGFLEGALPARNQSGRLHFSNLPGAFLATMTVLYAVVAFVGTAVIFGSFLEWVIG